MIPEEQLQKWEQRNEALDLVGSVVALIAEVRRLRNELLLLEEEKGHPISCAERAIELARLRDALYEAQSDFRTLDIIECDVCSAPDIETCGRCAVISVGLRKATAALGALDREEGQG